MARDRERHFRLPPDPALCIRDNQGARLEDCRQRRQPRLISVLRAEVAQDRIGKVTLHQFRRPRLPVVEILTERLHVLPLDMSPQSFNKTRQYVLSDKEASPPEPVGLVYPAVALDWSRTGLSTLDHVVGYDVYDGCVTGVVILFGHYQFLIYMGATSAIIAKSRSTYRVNPFLRLEKLDADFPLLDKLRALPRRGLNEFFRESFVTATTALLRFLKGDTAVEFGEQLVRRQLTEQLERTRSTDAARIIARTVAEEYALYCYVHGIFREESFAGKTRDQ